MWERRVGYAYYIAGLMGKRITYRRACVIASSFTEEELRRIYLVKKARSV